MLGFLFRCGLLFRFGKGHLFLGVAFLLQLLVGGIPVHRLLIGGVERVVLEEESDAREQLALAEAEQKAAAKQEAEQKKAAEKQSAEQKKAAAKKKQQSSLGKAAKKVAKTATNSLLDRVGRKIGKAIARGIFGNWL